MSKPAAPDEQGTSTRPYLIRALHGWCTDNGFTPYLAVYVSPSVQVPNEYVKNNEIVLNVGFEATSGLKLGNEYIEFRARFGGSPRDILVPVDHVVAIYARENGQGMAFPVPTTATPAAGSGEAASDVARGGGLRLAKPGDDPRDGPDTVPATLDRAPARPPDEPPSPPPKSPPKAPAPGGGRPALKRVK